MVAPHFNEQKWILWALGMAIECTSMLNELINNMWSTVKKYSSLGDRIKWHN
mgnify:CR=1 FL=1